MQDVKFEPSRYLTNLNGKEYLEVKFRLLWLRHDHPDAIITTEAHTITPDVAIMKATVSIPGGGSATDYGSETPGDFKDYIEKASTKAIGRALGALGYGTQFTDEHEFGAAQGRVVDAPVQRPQQQAQQQAPQFNNPQRQVPSTGDQATERQMSFLSTVATEAGLDQRMLRDRIDKITGGSRELTRREASALIDELKNSRQQNGGSEGANPKAPADRTAGKRAQLHIRLKELLPDEGDRERLLRSVLKWGYNTTTTTDLTWEQMDELLQTFTTDLQGVRDEVDAREIADGAPPPADPADEILLMPWEEELPF